MLRSNRLLFNTLEAVTRPRRLSGLSGGRAAGSRLTLGIACLVCGLLLGWNTSPVFGQGGGIAGGVGGGQGGGQGGQQGGQRGQAGQGGQAGGGNVGGILIDAQGVVRPAFTRDTSGKLDQKRRAELAGKSLPSELNTYSAVRKVSLVRLEAACEDFAARKQHVTGEMQFLAGLQRIDYIFVYPETKDLVLAGPAEGFVVDEVGRGIGVTTGRPALRLDDLMVALRALERGGPIGCSIDPLPANLAALKAYVTQNSNTTTPDVARGRFEEMARILGMQDVRVFGVPDDSHFAQTLVDADYRMKRLSLGIDPSPVRSLKSHLAMIGAGANTLERWWFAPLYTALIRSDDRLAYRFTGPRVQLMNQTEMVSDTGQRSASSAFTPVSTERYAKQFTEKYPELADASPTFGELQTLFDLAVMAALFKKDQLPAKAGWTPGLFLDPERATLVRQNVPRQVDTLCNYKSGRRLFIGLLGGGVTIEPMQTLNRIEFQSDAEGLLKKGHAAARTEKEPDPKIWWWD